MDGEPAGEGPHPVVRVSGQGALANFRRSLNQRWGGVSAPGWGGLDWSDWQPLDRSQIKAFAPHGPGVYRIRETGGTCLSYLGQTSRSLRMRLGTLRSELEREGGPFADPHVAAAYFWLLLTRDGKTFEFSCASLPGDKRHLRGQEDLLLWLHRVQTGASTPINYARFYPGFRAPTPTWIGAKAKGRRGRKTEPLSADELATAISDKHAPLLWTNGPITEAPWWSGSVAADEALTNLPQAPGVYGLFDPALGDFLYFGESDLIRKRIAQHLKTFRHIEGLSIFYKKGRSPFSKNCRYEWECDLLGNHYFNHRSPPEWQYRKHG